MFCYLFTVCVELSLTNDDLKNDGGSRTIRRFQADGDKKLKLTCRVVGNMQLLIYILAVCVKHVFNTNMSL